MNKLYILILGVLLIMVGGYFYFSSNKVLAPTEKPPTDVVSSSPKDATYIVAGQKFTLVNGIAKKEIVPGSATVDQLSLFGEPVFGDIDGDGDEDAVLILVNDSGGSGSFYYAALSINVDGKYQGTDAILLGDRIAPQTYRIINDRAEINYAVRGPEDYFTVQPSIGKTLYLKYNPETYQLIQVMSDFEGEADANTMKLDMHPWTWIKTTFSDKTEMVPKKPEAFKLTFKNDGTMSATTDCNSMGGSYEVTGLNMSFGPLAMTAMFCENSQEQDFAKLLDSIESYTFTGKGELVFMLKSGKGTATFH